MDSRVRHTGIDVIGDVSWGTHWCQFYQTKQDLLDVLVPYFRQGLADNEFCMWITCAPLEVAEARNALLAIDPTFEEYFRRHQIEILDSAAWYTPTGDFKMEEVLQAGAKKLQEALDRGYDGLRGAGNAHFAVRQDWAALTAYEEIVNRGISKYPALTICTYSLDDCDAAEIMDVMSNHRFSLIKRNGHWQIVESSEHQKAEAALRKSEQRLRLACTAARLGVFEWDIVSGTVYAENERMAEILGCEGPLSSRAFFASMIDRQDSFAFEHAFAEAKRLDQQFYSVCRTLPGIDGQQRWLEFSGRFSLAVDGSPQRLIGVVGDITERKRAEERLRRLNGLLEQRVREKTVELASKNKELQSRVAQLSRLASDLTLTEKRERNSLAKLLHDNLQQLLAAATVRLQAATESAVGSEHLTEIEEVHGLIQESLATCRSLTAELSPTILHEAGLAAGLAWLARWMEKKYGLVVELQADKDTEPSRQDICILLFESVRELLFNVVKHAGVNHAKVILSRSDEALRIVVSDEGIGFDADRIQAQNCEATGGFGLFSIRERLELLDGSLTVQSTPQQGSTLILVAPLVDAPLYATDREAPDTPCFHVKTRIAGTKLSILLVDDHSIFRQAMAVRLQREPDIEIAGEAGNGQEAIDKARRFRPDVILMDFSMPQMDGVEATRRIHAELPDIRIIGLSMYEEADRAQAMLDAGASAYVTKTAGLEQLLKAIRDSSPPHKQTSSPDQNLDD